MHEKFFSNNKGALSSGTRFGIAGLLAFLFYQLFDLQFGYWAVVTVAAVMQPNTHMTVKKCMLRLLGTVIGVAISYVALEIIIRFPQLLYVLFFISMFISGLLMFKNKEYIYAGIVCGTTTIIIITTYSLTPTYFYNIIFIRTIDVIVGILLAWICSSLIFPRKEKSNKTPKAVKPISTPMIIKNASLIAISTTLSLIPWFSVHYSGGFWAPIACLFVLEDSIDKTNQKAIKRFVSHVIVLLLTAVLSFLLKSSYGLAIALVIGMFIFGFCMEKPLLGLDASMANTMAIAYCLVLLVSPGETNTFYTASARFLNTILGIGVGILIAHAFQTKSSATQPSC